MFSERGASIRCDRHRVLAPGPTSGRIRGRRPHDCRQLAGKELRRIDSPSLPTSPLLEGGWDRVCVRLQGLLTCGLMTTSGHTGGGAGKGGNGVPAQAERADAPTRILVVLPNWVGDLVLATPALRALREHFTRAHIAFLARPNSAVVIDGATWMDEVIYWPLRKRQPRPQRRQGFLGFTAELRERRFDMAVLLANSFRSALAVRLAGVRRRVGYDRDGRGLLLTDRLLPEKANGKYIPTPMTRYYNAIARYLGCREVPTELELFTTPEDEAEAARAIDSAGGGDGRPAVVLNPGASFGSAKCWLPEHFAAVADCLVERRRAAVLISCGPKEVEIARAVARAMKQKATVLDHPIMALGPMKALIRRAGLLITNDTGPRHFANAFRTPAVTIFGPTDPEWTRTESSTERSLMVPVDCGPCMKRTCPLDHRCMTRITPDMVLAAAEELLDVHAPSPRA